MFTLFFLLACSEEPAPPEPDATTRALQALEEAERAEEDLERQPNGPLPGELALRRRVQQNQGQLQPCVERAGRNGLPEDGKVQLGWTVEDGQAVDVQRLDSSDGSQALADCMVEVVSGWTFPPEVQGSVVWPFSFHPVD